MILHYSVPDQPWFDHPEHPGNTLYSTSGPLGGCVPFDGNCPTGGHVEDQMQARWSALQDYCESFEITSFPDSFYYTFNAIGDSGFEFMYGPGGGAIEYEGRYVVGGQCGAYDPDPDTFYYLDGLMGVGYSRYVKCPADMTIAPKVPGPINDVNSVLCRNSDAHASIRVNVMQTESKCELGNPCDPITGNKVQRETDLSSGQLSFSRTYNSMAQAHGFANGWTHTYQAHIVLHSGAGAKFAVRSDGEIVSLKYGPSPSGGLMSSGGSQLFLPDRANNEPIEVVLPDGTREFYDRTFGQLQKIVSPNGKETVLAYDAEPVAFTIAPRLITVSGPFGHQLNFEYYEFNPGVLQTVTNDAMESVTFDYDGIGNLTKATYADASERFYHYDSIDPNLPNHLTGITDEREIRSSDYDYDAQGRAKLTTKAGGFGKFEFTYNANGTTTVRDGDNQEHTYGSTTVGLHNTLMISSYSNSAGSASGLGYDVVGNPVSSANRGRMTSRVDRNNHETEYVFDSFHMTQMTEAKGEGDLERTTTYSAFVEIESELPTVITQPSIHAGGAFTTTIDYGGDLLPDSVTQDGYRMDALGNPQPISRKTTLTYYTSSDSIPLSGLLKSVDGPRLVGDAIDTVDYFYYDCVDGNECGQLERVEVNVDSLVLTTRYTEYDAAGRVLRVLDPNDTETVFTYDTRGRIDDITQTTSDQMSRLTEYEYLDNGLLFTLTLPGGGRYEYAYNDAGLLERVTELDSMEYVEYGYNGRGQRNSVKSFRDGNEIASATQFEFDINNHLDRIIGAVVSTDVDDLMAGIITDLSIDPVGNTTGLLDGNGNLTSFVPDALDRLKEVIDPLNLTTDLTEYDYDVADNVASVTSPNGAVTAFEYDDFGNVTKEDSSDRGVIVYTYDEASNLKSMTDGRNITVNYEYDALNRLTARIYLDSCQNVTFTYDQGVDAQGAPLENAMGRLASVEDHLSANPAICAESRSGTGPQSYSYNGFGEVIKTSRKLGHVDYSLEYTYDDLGNVSTMKYPSGRLVTYMRDVYGDVTSVTTQGTGVNAPVETIVSNVKFEPTGPLQGYTYGNGLVYSRSFDLQARLTADSLAVSDSPTAVRLLDDLYELDNVGNIEVINDLLPNNHDRTYNYDLLYRLDDADHQESNLFQDFTYDENGNRKTLAVEVSNISTDQQTHVIEPNSNQLDSYLSTANGLIDFAYDDAGNRTTTTEPGLITHYNYNDAGRLHYVEREINSVSSEIGRYVYNALGQRVQKDTPASGTLNYFYDLSGNLIAEADENSVILVDYIYLGGRPIALVGSDRDGDGEPDASDNCVVHSNPMQENTNEVIDGYGHPLTDEIGNACDPDLNNDNIVNYGDNAQYSPAHNTQPGHPNWDPDADFNSDGVINFGDYFILVQFFQTKPGPAGSSGVAEDLGLKFIHSDYLDTPVKVYDASQNELWSGSRDAFGNTIVDEDPGNTGSSLTLNIRFPGQYEDAESGLFYNYFRYYDPSTGRYITSDPIGLAAGSNTYAYVGNTPTMYFDPYGLEPYAQDFWANYLDYDNNTSTEAWNKIGGNLNKTYGPYSNSCAARVSYGLNYGGEPIPANVPGGNRNYGGDNKRYIVSARQLRSYLQNRWGGPDKALSTRADLSALMDSLSPDQVAVVVSQGHAAVVSKSYKDPYVDGFLGDAWILPLKPEPSECGACNE